MEILTCGPACWSRRGPPGNAEGEPLASVSNKMFEGEPTGQAAPGGMHDCGVKRNRPAVSRLMGATLLGGRGLLLSSEKLPGPDIAEQICQGSVLGKELRMSGREGRINAGRLHQAEE